MQQGTSRSSWQGTSRYTPPQAPVPTLSTAAAKGCRSGDQWVLPPLRIGRTRPYHRRLFAELTRSGDTIVALTTLGIAFLASNADQMPQGLDDFLRPRFTLANVIVLGVFGIVWKHIFLTFGLYNVLRSRSFRSEAPAVCGACAVGAVVTLLFPFLSHSGAFTTRTALAFWPLVTASTLVVRYGLRKIAERAHARSEVAETHRVLIVGTGPLAHRLVTELEKGTGTAHEILGFVDTNTNVQHEAIRRRVIGTLDDLESILMHNVVDEVLVALPVKSHYEAIERVIGDCERAGVQLTYSADVFRASRARVRHDSGEGQAVVTMEVVANDYRLGVKRAIDFLVASLGLLLISPVLAVIALAVKVTSPGPIVFAQERYGLRKRRFRMYKFRTMVTGAEALQSKLESLNEASGPVFKIREDPRVTRVGRFLRKTSLDELPQLWNVVRGEMSLVGPRPLPIRDVQRFTQAELMRRFSVLPGMTGLWQISGRSGVGFDDWIKLDLQYIDNWSLASDIGILARTIPVVFRGTGAV